MTRDKEDIGLECEQCYWGRRCKKKPLATATVECLCKYFVSKSADDSYVDASYDALVNDGYVKG
jgi:hypothetical protein